jgi:peptidoglycan/xylan/chitin deacetylase (PgdA/CDA1 family)
MAQPATSPRTNRWHGMGWFRWGTSVSVLLLLAASIVAFAAPAQAASPTVVSLTFDDGNDNQLAAEQVLKANGLVGTFFITTSWIGQAGWLTQANLHTIATDGNEIGGHTVTHPDLTTISSSAATAEVCNGRTTLTGWGFSVTNFAYPFASTNTTVQNIVKNCGFASGRNLGDIRSPASCGSCAFAETLPPPNPYETKALDEVDSTWTLANLQNSVINAENNGGGWVQLTFHHIATGTDPTLTISPTLFNQFVTWLAARTANGTTTVRTVAQALGQTPPPPPAPTAPAAPTGVTAVAGNASATVNWTAPNNGGSAITSYTVTPFVGTVAQTPVQVTGAPPATTTTVSGLTNGTAYTFTVTATNSVGPSPASAASAPVTPTAPVVPTAPAAPTGVTAVAGNASATVNWTAPNNGGSAITSYTVTPFAGTVAQTPVQVTGAPPATTTTVSGLTNGTAYTFTVTATNSVGPSPASAASAPVTPTAPVTPPSQVANGGFESGLTSWTTGGVSAPKAATIVHSGTGSAMLGVASGNEPLGDSTLAQSLTIPATGTSGLSFWYQPHTTDGTCGGTTVCRWDWMEAQVRSSAGATLASLFKLNNNRGVWTQVTADLSAYRGQTITLWFNVHLDGAVPADNTWMYLDDVTLTTSVPQPATAPAAPTGVTAAAGNASASVNWTAPNDGGSAITSYTVTPFAGTVAQTPVQVTGAPPATHTTVTGLTNGTAYTFTVTATNSVGTSPASAASAPVTPSTVVTPPASVANGGFESGLTSWVAGGVSAPKAATVAHTGTGSALLGVITGSEQLGDSTLSQTITVPATGTSTLTFWYQPHTTDGTCGATRVCRWDWMEGQVRSSTGTTLASLFKLNNDRGTWTQVTANLSAYRGQTVTLWFNVHLDGAVPADNTWMYLDDVVLTNG